MTQPTRRSLLRGSLGVAAATAPSRPHIARAAAKTATVWWGQGVAEQEDISYNNSSPIYERASGNTLDYAIIPYVPLRQKIVSAITSGEVPDLFQNNPNEILALYAWDDKLVDVSDIVEPLKANLTPAALNSVRCYNATSKKRSFYGVPYLQASLLNHIWRRLVEKAGAKVEDIPKTWDARYDFFKGLRKKLREQSMRNIFGVGFAVSAVEVDTNNQFNQFVIAYGGGNLVGKEGRLHWTLHPQPTPAQVPRDEQSP